jgi:hypothetical protein
VRALTSLLLAILFVVLAGAEGFGRFGYRSTPELPGLSLDMSGFRSKSPQADKIEFASPARQWKLAAASAEGQTVLLNAQALGPRRRDTAYGSPALPCTSRRECSLSSPLRDALI